MVLLDHAAHTRRRRAFPSTCPTESCGFFGVALQLPMRWPSCRLQVVSGCSEIDGVELETGVVGIGRASSNTKNSAGAEEDGVADAHDLTMPSAFLAIPRGRGCRARRSVGSASQIGTMVVSAKNGSIVAEAGSGIRLHHRLVDRLQPAIESRRTSILRRTCPLRSW